MSDYKKEAKAASAAKMQRMGLKLEDGSKSFTDERGGSPFEGLNSGNAGKMPITPSRFKRGGKVAHVAGEKAHKNLGKAPRKGRGHYASKGAVPMGYYNDEEIPPNVPFKSTQGGNTEASRYGAARKQAEQDADFATKKMNDYANPFKIDTDSKDAMAARYTAERSLANRKTAAQQQGYGDYARGGQIGRKQAAAISYKKKGAGLSSKMNLPKISGLPNVAADTYVPRKSGGAAKHTDEAQDKKLMHKVLKQDAFKERAHKMGGGAMSRYMDAARENLSANKKYKDQQLLSNLKSKMYGSSSRPYSPADIMDTERTMSKRQRGIRMAADKLSGNANVPATNDEEMNKGGRAHRATGGRTKGKTNVNIIISPQSGGQGQGVLGAGVGMGQPPVPPMMPPVPPQMPPMPPAGGMPMGGAPQLPPQLMAALAARGGAGGPPMPRKTGGRVGNVMPKYQEKDYGSGSGLGRLVKKKWPTANGTE
jgi:hypothetical protein